MDIFSVGELIRLAQQQARRERSEPERSEAERSEGGPVREAGVLVLRDNRSGLVFRRQYYPDWAAAIRAGNAVLRDPAYRGTDAWIDLPDGSRIDFH